MGEEKRGRFIVFEGINGCGKTTQRNLFLEYFESTIMLPVICTLEPNKIDENGTKARAMLKSDRDPYEKAQEAVKYFALNRQTHSKYIIKKLEEGDNVLCSRYWHSNFAFQHAQGISYEDIVELNKGCVVPDLTYILDLDLDEAFKRLSRRDDADRRKFDSNKSFMEKVLHNYLELKSKLPRLIGDHSIVLVDSRRSIADTAKQIQDIYNSRLNKT